MLSEEQQVIDELFEADIKSAFWHMAALIRQHRNDADALLRLYEEYTATGDFPAAARAKIEHDDNIKAWQNLSRALAQKVVEKINKGNIKLISPADLILLGMLGIELPILDL